MENEVNEILEQGDVVEGYQEPVEEITEPVEELPEQEEAQDAKPEVKPEKKKLTAEERQAQIAHQTKLKWEAHRAMEAKQAELDAKIAKLEALEKKNGIQEDLPPDPSRYQEGQERQYIQDLANYEAQKILKKERETEQKQRSESEKIEHVEAIKTTYAKQYQEKVNKDPNFAERELNVARYLELTKRDDLISIIMDDDDRADIIDYLGGNLEELENLAKLPPLRVAKEFGKITARISTPTSRTVSKAPAPMNPVRQTGTNAVRNLDEMDHDSYSEMMNKKQFGY
jgi:hypothetical protein